MQLLKNEILYDSPIAPTAHMNTATTSIDATVPPNARHRIAPRLLKNLRRVVKSLMRCRLRRRAWTLVLGATPTTAA